MLIPSSITSWLGDVVHIGQLVVAHLVAGGVGYSARYAQEILRARKRRRNIESLFGLTGRHVYVVHSAIFDEQRQAFNFPSCDSGASRIVAHLLEETGRVETRDFEILPVEEFEARAGRIDTGPEAVVIAICGPKRNRVVADVLAAAPRMRYQVRVDSVGRSTLRDEEVGSDIAGSANVSTDHTGLIGPGTDFGLVVSMPNPFNAAHRITVIAGLRGSGTLGAAQILTDPATLAAICKRHKGGVVEELVKVVWSDQPEHLTRVSLVR